jgi:hypothetical protein
LAALSLGCGRLVEALTREPLPGALVVPVGFAVAILAGQLATLGSATAQLAGPLVIALAAAGLLLAPPWPLRAWGWPAGAAAGAFAAYAAPIVLSGQATFAGYIKLDDTATYFAMTDRVMSHARDLAGLAPSTYEATLAFTLKIGYPTGSLMPIGIGHQLTGYDIAWLFQPYLAFLAAMLALTLYGVLTLVIPWPAARAGAAFFAAQPAILYGYALWGGIKEVSGAYLLALISVLIPWTLDSRRGAAAVVPLAAACAALVCVLSLPGGAWLLPALLAAGVIIAVRPDRALLRKAGAFALALGVLGIPAFVAGAEWLKQIGNFGKESELGNLVQKLSVLQLFGIWPGGDFRYRHDPAPVKVLIALVIVAAVLGLWWAWTRGGWALLVYVAVTALGCAGYLAVSSPWIGGKTIAMAAPAFLAAAFAACAGAALRGRVVEAGVVAVAIAGGVLWSNVDQYHDVWLAPRGQLHELETIGDRIAGQGPTLMTDYQSYGARHFLRRADPEGASELRRRFVYLTNGQVLPNQAPWADIDRFRLDQVLVYRTLVLRRGPLASRPPSVYRLVSSGRYYETWQRPPRPANTIVRHLGLDTSTQPDAVPRCSDVLRLAKLPGVTALATATRPPSISLGAPPLSGPKDVDVDLPQGGSYTAWLGSDWYGNASIAVDGHEVGSKREELNWPGLYTPLGTIHLPAGRHLVTIRYTHGGWRPGSGAKPTSFQSAALSRVDDRERVETVPVSAARSLCGRRLDWVEALR